MKPPVISIVIPTDGRAAALRRCVESIAAQQSPPPFELLVSAPSNDAVGDLVKAHVPRARIYTADASTAAERRNLLITEASGELVLFLDDDVVIPPHYLHALGEQAEDNPDADVFGGPNVTPSDSTRFQVVQGAVMSALFGAGPVRRRYGPHPATDADERWFTLCNLAVRRSVVKVFDGDLVGGEENALLDELHRAGARMRYDPTLWAAHERRGNLAGFARQIYKYGRGRGQLTRRAPRTLRPAYLVPSATLLGILALAIAAPASDQSWLAALIAVYPLALVVQSIKIASSLGRPSSFFSAFVTTLVMHGSYGGGVIAGLLAPQAGPMQRGSPRHTWNVLRVLVKRQLRLLRKRSVLGLLWPLLTPWVMLALYAFVFHTVLNVPIPRYGVFLFAGLLPWSFLSQTLANAVASLSIEADLIRRARFSYWLLPIAVEIALSTYFLLTLALFIGYLGMTGDLNWSVLPAILLPVASIYFFVGALSCVLALIDVYNRDLRQILTNVLTVWFFLVPIVYQQQMLSRRLLFTRSIDPLNLIVGEFRDVLYNGHLFRPLHDVIVLFATAVLLFLATSLINRFGSSLPKDA